MKGKICNGIFNHKLYIFIIFAVKIEEQLVCNKILNIFQHEINRNNFGHT